MSSQGSASPDQEGQDQKGQEQPFVSHLLELRDRLLRAVLAVVVVLLVLLPFANDLYTFLAGPLMKHLPETSSMIAIEVASPFLTPFKLALVTAIFVSMPYLLHQMWGFIAPGLYQEERRLAFPLLFSSIVLFYSGMAFAYYVVFPLVFGFLTGIAPEGVSVMTDISRYLDFVLKLFFAFGVAFEVPIATFVLVWTGATTPEKLAAKRPYIIVGAFVLGMLLTPPDIISQSLLALPMWLLFEAGVWFSRMFVRRREEAAEQTPAPAAAPAGTAATGASAATESAVHVDSPDEWAADEEYYEQLGEEEMDAELDRLEAEEDALLDDAGEDVTEVPDEDGPEPGEEGEESGKEPRN